MASVTLTRFQDGIPGWESYLATCTRNVEQMEAIRVAVVVPPEHERFLRSLRERQLKVLVLTEDW